MTDPERAVIDAAIGAWTGHRPVRWTLAQHLANPLVNCSGEQEKTLAAAVAAYLSAQKEATSEP